MDYTLTFDIKSYWHIGSGQEAAAYADALTLKDANQLPYLPGKSIKGLLREAFQTAIDNNWFDSQYDLISTLFGNEGLEGTQKQGMLQISNATLSDTEKNYFKNNKDALTQLYKVTFSTAINENTGVAKNTSLRSIEVSIPMCLQASLSLNTALVNQEVKNNGQEGKNIHHVQDSLLIWLNQASSLITELGAKRHRGLGKVIVTAKAKE